MQHAFDPVLDAHFAKCKGAGGDGPAVDAAGKQRLGIVCPGIVIQRLDDLLVAGKLDVAAKQDISEPHKRIEPIDREKQEAKRLPKVILAAKMRLFVRYDVLGALLDNTERQIYARLDDAENEG